MVYTNEQMTPLVRACIGRRNDYAIQRDNGLYVRTGQPLTSDVLREHLLGRVTIGTYLIDEQGCCRFAVFDADGDDGLLRLLDLQAHLAADGMGAYLEGSRRGGHLWLFLARPILAGVVRGWLQPYQSAGVELYPKQDKASDAHPGSLIRVPFGVHRRSGRRYPFVALVDGKLMPVVRTVAAGLAFLSTVERVDVPADLFLSASAASSGGNEHKKYPSKASTPCRKVSPGMSIRDWCAGQDALSVIGRYVTLDARGMGCCPFSAHHAAGRDRHPSLWVYAPQGKDIFCWWCHTWQQGGSLFDFLRLYHGLDARDLWRRLLAGEVF